MIRDNHEHQPRLCKNLSDPTDTILGHQVQQVLKFPCARCVTLNPANMWGVELSDVSARLSSMIFRWGAVHAKVSRVIDERTLEMTATNAPVDEKSFWPDELDNVGLTEEQRAQMYLRFQTSNNCNNAVLLFAYALKCLCDDGVPLCHEGQPVVDIRVLNANEFDVSDILDTRILQLKDCDSEVTIPSVSTYENKANLRKVSPSVLRNCGFMPPPVEPAEEDFKKLRPKSYTGTVPHWWIAAITEGYRLGAVERRMVHLDICGAAYDDKAFQVYNGSLVSLQMFCTPDYEIIPAFLVRPDLRHKFILRSRTRAKISKDSNRIVSLQPWSVRHFRCYHLNDSSGVEVTTLPTYIDRNMKTNSPETATFNKSIASLRDDIVHQVPAGTEVEVRNLKARPELNGRRGRVHESVTETSLKERIPVWVDGVNHPLSLKMNCLCPVANRKQYLSHAEVLKAATENIPSKDPQPPPPNISSRQRQAIQRTISQDTDVAMAFQTMMAGKVSISTFEDAQFVKGIKKLISHPLNQILPPGSGKRLEGGIEFTKHPKSKEAFAILKLLKAGKQRAMELDPSCVRGDGAFALKRGSDYHRLIDKVAKKIRQDPGLSELFEELDTNGDYPNPVKQLGNLSLPS